MKLQPFDLLDFFFLVLIAMIAGTLTVVVPLPAAPAEPTPQPPVVTPAAAPPPPVSEEERGALENANAVLLREYHLIASQLQSARTEAERLAEERRQRQELIDKLNQLASEKHKDSGAIDAKLSASQAENLRKAAEAERLKQVMQQKRDELARLEKSLEGLPPPVGLSGGADDSKRGRVSRSTNKKAVVVECVNDRVVPVDKDHFGFISIGQNTLAVRKEGIAGEAVGDMGKPGSKFRKQLAELDKDKQLLFCLVNDDSFDAFRRAREIAEELGIGVGWTPYDSKDRKIVFGAGGRSPDEQR